MLLSSMWCPALVSFSNRLARKFKILYIIIIVNVANRLFITYFHLFLSYEFRTKKNLTLNWTLFFWPGIIWMSITYTIFYNYYLLIIIRNLSKKGSDSRSNDIIPTINVIWYLNLSRSSSLRFCTNNQWKTKRNRKSKSKKKN